jgi:hypothetical protein
VGDTSDHERPAVLLALHADLVLPALVVVDLLQDGTHGRMLSQAIVLQFETVHFQVAQEGALIEGKVLLVLSPRWSGSIFFAFCGMAWLLVFLGLVGGGAIASSLKACRLELLFIFCSFFPFIFGSFK